MSLVQWPFAWGAWSRDQPSSQWRAFPQCPTWTSPDAASTPFPRALLLVTRETRSPAPPHCPPWGRCRQWWGPPSAFSSASWTNQVTLASPCKSCPKSVYAPISHALHYCLERAPEIGKTFVSSSWASHSLGLGLPKTTISYCPVCKKKVWGIGKLE